MSVRADDLNVGREGLRRLVADNYPVIARSLLRPLLHCLSTSREACGGDVDKFLIMLVIAIRTTEHEGFAAYSQAQLLSGEIPIFPDARHQCSISRGIDGNAQRDGPAQGRRTGGGRLDIASGQRTAVYSARLPGVGWRAGCDRGACGEQFPGRGEFDAPAASGTARPIAQVDRASKSGPRPQPEGSRSQAGRRALRQRRACSQRRADPVCPGNDASRWRLCECPGARASPQ